MLKIWTYFWAYLFVGLELLDRAGDWLAYQVDHNDYLAGAVFVVVLFEFVWAMGIIDVVVR